MIVPDTPTFTRALREAAPPLIRLFIWDVGVTLLYFWYKSLLGQLELPLALFGTALALFLGFRDNAAYARWWEARSLWGQMINASRSLARELVALLATTSARDASLAQELIRRQIAYVNCLRCNLRDEECEPELRRFLKPEEVILLKDKKNIPNALLNISAKRLAEAAQQGQIDTYCWVRLETTFIDITNAQGGMERIKRTPLPMHYRSIPAIFVQIFCLLLPFVIVQDLGIYTPLGSTLVGLMLIAALQVGDDLMDPFANKVHDVPMTAICRTIEIDLLQTLGLPAPEPLAPVKGVLM
jgi:putative membrane protein